MAFIDKKDPVVLNIKLTSTGRSLLSRGKLDFKYYAIGDSEIDYEFNDVSNLDPFYSNILKPADKNPNIISFVTKELSGDPYNLISSIPSIPTIIQNTVQPIGFFNITTGNTSFIVDSDHIKQPDIMIKISGITGGTILNINKAPTYLANVNEPSIGDFIMIKWTTPNGNNTTGYSLNINNPTPYIIYKIQDIASGSLFTDNLIVQVDRNLPCFSGITGSSSVVAGGLIFYDYINFTGDTIYGDYSTDYLNESVLAFLQNAQCPTITFPFWNMSIIYTNEIVGVQSYNKTFGSFNSKKYGGFVSYIQNQAPLYKKLGVIHYSNSSPSNTYGEELFQNTPTLTIPTIMWHKSSTKTLGLTLRANGSIKLLTGTTKSLNTSYYDLADLNGNIVGKVFNDLKIFVIEDQELLFAMSYKSNRSWTLPNYTVGINDNVTVGCSPCFTNFDYTINNPTKIGNSDGSFIISNIETVGTKLILEVSGATSGQVYLESISVDDTITIPNLSADTYYATIHDLNAIGCLPTEIVLTNPVSVLGMSGLTISQSGLISDFTIGINNPTSISITNSVTNVGETYGTVSFIVCDYGTEFDDIATSWMDIPKNDTRTWYPLTFGSAYRIFIRDVSGSTVFWAYKDYVAVGNPLWYDFNFTDNLSDSGGTYVLVSNYLTTINPSINPIIGDIEIAAYSNNVEYPTMWSIIPSAQISSEPVWKVYVEDPIPYQYNKISVREKYNQIEMFRVTK
jgi:hypothetical protein